MVVQVETGSEVVVHTSASASVSIVTSAGTQVVKGPFVCVPSSGTLPTTTPRVVGRRRRSNPDIRRDSYTSGPETTGTIVGNYDWSSGGRRST